MTPGTRTGGQLVCAALAAAGCNVIFSVSGNQILPIFDAAAEAGIRIVHMRHESAAAYAAAAYAELSGGVGVALTSAGPGFLAGLQGVAAAATMELPLLYLSGDSSGAQRGQGAFQEFDQATVAGAVCKSSATVDNAGEIPSVFARAVASASSGVPGPAHIALPGDILSGLGAPDAAAAPAVATSLDEAQRAQVEDIAGHLRQARRPLILARPAAMRGAVGAHLAALATTLGVEPIAIEAPRGLADLKYASISARLPESDCALVLAPPDFALGFLSRDQLARDGLVLLVDTPEDPEPSQPVDLHLQADALAVLEHLRSVLPTGMSIDPDWSAL